MNYEIKTAYRAAVPGFENLAALQHQGWYWSHEVAERFVNGGGAKQGRVFEHEVIVITDGDTLWAQPEMVHDHEGSRPTGNTTIEKIRVYENSDEELKEAALERLPSLWKKVLGLPYDEEVAATQRFNWKHATDDQMRNKLLVLDITEEEARVLGLGQARTDAIDGFQAICEKQEEDEKQKKIDHPLLGTKTQLLARSSSDRDSDFQYHRDFRVKDVAPDAEDGETQYRCEPWEFLSYIHKDDEKQIVRKSDLEAQTALIGRKFVPTKPPRTGSTKHEWEPGTTYEVHDLATKKEDSEMHFGCWFVAGDKEPIGFFVGAWSRTEIEANLLEKPS